MVGARNHPSSIYTARVHPNTSKNLTMASATPVAHHHTLSVEGHDFQHQQTHEMELCVANQSSKWVLSSPDPPGFFQQIFGSIKNVFPQRNCKRSSSSLSQKKQSTSARVIAVLSSVFPVLNWGRN